MTLDSSLSSLKDFEDIDEDLELGIDRLTTSSSGHGPDSVVVQVDGTKAWSWRQLLEFLFGSSAAFAGCDCVIPFGQLRRFVKLQIGQGGQEKEGVAGDETEDDEAASGSQGSNPFLDRQTTVVVRKSGRRRIGKRGVGSGGGGDGGGRDDDDELELDESDGFIDWDQFGVPEEQRFAATPSSTVTRFFSSTPSRREFFFSSFSSHSSGER
ncbi:unnamed protein product [Calypogeia fissa]